MKSCTQRATAFGVLSGVLIAILGWVVLVAAYVWDDRRRMSDLSEEPAYLTAVWSRLTDTDGLPFWAAVGASVAALGAANGGIGGWAGCRTGRRDFLPVLWVALLPLLYPVAVYAKNPAGVSKLWGGAFVLAIFIIPFVWVAGRVGQELGVRQRQAEPSAAVDSASGFSSGR